MQKPPKSCDTVRLDPRQWFVDALGLWHCPAHRPKPLQLVHLISLVWCERKCEGCYLTHLPTHSISLRLFVIATTTITHRDAVKPHWHHVARWSFNRFVNSSSSLQPRPPAPVEVRGEWQPSPHLLMRTLMPLSEADTAAKLHSLLQGAERG